MDNQHDQTTSKQPPKGTPKPKPAQEPTTPVKPSPKAPAKPKVSTNKPNPKPASVALVKSLLASQMPPSASDAKSSATTAIPIPTPSAVIGKPIPALSDTKEHIRLPEDFREQLERASGKKISDKNVFALQNLFGGLSPNTGSSVNQSGNAYSQAAKLKAAEFDVDKAKKALSKHTDTKHMDKMLEALKPAFDSVQKSISFVGKMNQKRDFDDQHYTVPTTQSLFSLTANQIGSTPFWRG